MKKTVFFETPLKRCLENAKCDGFSAGLLLGQSSEENDIIVHLARTQASPKDSTGVGSFKQINDLKEEYILDHIRNVIQILPGGITVLGLFFVGENNLLSNPASINKVNNILNAINKFIENNEFYFLNTCSTSKLLLHYVDNTNINCKRFSPSRSGNQFDVIDCVFTVNVWHRINCYYDFEQLLPSYVETISNTILHDKFMDILKYVSRTVKESVLLFNGELRNSSDFIKSVKEQSSKRATPNTSETDVEPPLMADVYTPCVPQLENAVCEISEYVAELKCFGTLCSDVYLHKNATVDEAIRAVKEDIIRSLYSRLMMHCNSLLEDLSSSSPDDTKIIHEPPRRISVILPHSKVRFMDYLFPGEDNMSSLPAKEQLDIRDIDDELSLYESLEAETDASEFYNSNDVTDYVTENPKTRKNKMNYTILMGIILSLLILIFAYFFQKLRSS